MRPYLALAFSLLLPEAIYAASCCVSNTGFSNLMILPSKWQQTFTVTQARVIGDTDTKGSSTFRSDRNRDTTTAARLDLGYSWTHRYQTNVAVKYQNRSREFQGDSASDSGWSDVGLSHAYQAPDWRRMWFFQSLNIPTANSNYDTRQKLGVDAQGSGTYLLSQGVVGIVNRKEWDFILGPELHYSFGRSFERDGEEVQVMSSTGGSFLLGAGYIPWRSKTRYGVSLNPRYEGPRAVRNNGEENRSDRSLVWDGGLNVTHTFNAEYSLGLNYLDQTIVGPARNTLLVRSLGLAFQARIP